MYNPSQPLSIIDYGDKADKSAFLDSVKDLMTASLQLRQKKAIFVSATEQYEAVKGEPNSTEEVVGALFTALTTAKWSLEAQKSVVKNSTDRVLSFLTEDQKSQLSAPYAHIAVYEDVQGNGVSSTFMRYGLFMVEGEYEVEGTISPNVLHAKIRSAQGGQRLNH